MKGQSSAKRRRLVEFVPHLDYFLTYLYFLLRVRANLLNLLQILNFDGVISNAILLLVIGCFGIIGL